MESSVLETYNRLLREQEAIFDEVLYEADLVAREQYAVRTAVEAAVKAVEERVEEKVAMEIAKRCKTSQIPLEAIARCTGLSLEVVQSL
jgi:hypothetical protein